MFLDGSHIIPVKVDDITWTLSAAVQQRVVNQREKMPAMIRGMVGHCFGYLVEEICTPTFSTAPTQVGLAAALNRLTIKAENSRVAIDLTGPDLRALEMYENRGQIVSPEPDLNSASTNPFYSSRLALFAPPGYRGSPKDFVLPNFLLAAGSVEPNQAVKTDISADCTAGTVRRIVTALCVALDRVRIGPKTEAKAFNAGGNVLELGERCLLSSLMLTEVLAHTTAFTAGDYSSFTLDDRKGNIYNGVDAAQLTRLFWAQNGTGQFGHIQGELRAATDDNLKVVNGATPTAIASPGALYQPLVWPGNGASINNVEPEGPFKLSWPGSVATGHFIARRIFPRSQQEAHELATQVFQGLNLPYKGAAIRGAGRGPYVGPRPEYQAWDFLYR